MKTYRVLLMVAFVVALSATVSLGTLLTFDELPVEEEYGTPIPAGYGEFDWSDFRYHPGISAGYKNGMVTEPHVAYNFGENPAMLADGKFDFVGAYFAGAWNDDLNIKVEGLVDDIIEYSETIVVSYHEPTWHSFEFIGIDELKFTSFGGHDADPGDLGTGHHFVMDNFTFVPEPATLSLLSPAGLAMLRKRRS